MQYARITFVSFMALSACSGVRQVAGTPRWPAPNAPRSAPAAKRATPDVDAHAALDATAYRVYPGGDVGAHEMGQDVDDAWSEWHAGRRVEALAKFRNVRTRIRLKGGASADEAIDPARIAIHASRTLFAYMGFRTYLFDAQGNMLGQQALGGYNVITELLPAGTRAHGILILQDTGYGVTLHRCRGETVSAVANFKEANALGVSPSGLWLVYRTFNGDVHLWNTGSQQDAHVWPATLGIEASPVGGWTPHEDAFWWNEGPDSGRRIFTVTGTTALEHTPQLGAAATQTASNSEPAAAVGQPSASQVSPATAIARTACALYMFLAPKAACEP
jgi:hypothetical protein